jgi:hypothetical protein
MTLTPEYLAELKRLCDEAKEASSVDEPVARSFYASSLRQGFSALPALITEVERLTANELDAAITEAERDRLRILMGFFIPLAEGYETDHPSKINRVLLIEARKAL